jgi:hypothetical protein
MDDANPEVPEEMTSNACGRVATGGHLEGGGWWRYPDGCYAAESDAESLRACSRACARQLEQGR